MLTIQVVRRKRTVRMYSTPSGHAIAISTSDPKSTASPRLLRSRKSASGPRLFDDSVPSSVTPVVTVGAVIASVVGGVVSPGTVVVVSGATATTGSLATVKVRLLEPAGCKLRSVITHATVQSPLGAAEMSDAESVVCSGASRSTVPNGTIAPPQVMVTVLVGPNC